MVEWLVELDRAFFLWINTELTAPFLDEIMPIMRHRNTWFPLYIVILIFAVVKLKWKAVPWIIGLVGAVGFADIISSQIFKPYVGRLRPCHELSPVYEHMILRLKRCSGHNSFTSSHAANHMAIASFIVFASSQEYRKYLTGFFVWVFMICWAQIYVGVHYPLDILGGLMIGTFTAFAFNKLYHFLVRKNIFVYGSKR